MIVATYPMPNAYAALMKASNGKGVTGPDGSYIWARPKDPKSVLVAWPKVSEELEVYDPLPTTTATIAESGKLTPVG